MNELLDALLVVAWYAGLFAACIGLAIVAVAIGLRVRDLLSPAEPRPGYLDLTGRRDTPIFDSTKRQPSGSRRRLP